MISALLYRCRVQNREWQTLQSLSAFYSFRAHHFHLISSHLSLVATRGPSADVRGITNYRFIKASLAAKVGIFNVYNYISIN